MNVEINKKVRVFLDERSFGIDGIVTGIERREDDTVSSILLDIPSAPDVGSLYFGEEEITNPGFKLEPAEGSLPN